VGGYPIAVPILSDIDIAGHPVNTALLGIVLAFLVGWIAAYLIYKIFWRSDFGLPVRRRLLCSGLTIQRDQVAFVPLWWSDLQIQRAVSAHWKNSLRSTVSRAPVRDDLTAR
jgi:hypothetical protein